MEEEISKLKEELSKVKKENTKLLGQVSILRANIASIEKENYNYKCQKSNSVLGNLSKLEEAKEQVKYLKTENRLIENQLKTFFKDKDAKLTLESPFVDGSFDLYPFDYERLKKIHDLYFFEFKQALNTELVKKELNRLKKNYNIFTKFFVILCIKKELFEHFFSNLIYGYSFQDFPDSKNIFKVLKHFPIDWMQRFFLDKSVCDSLKDFINSNIENVSVVIFYTRVIEYRSYLLNFIMTIDIFTKIVKRRDFYSNFLLRTMAQNKINQFIDHSNLHFLEEEHLKVFFKEEYVPL